MAEPLKGPLPDEKIGGSDAELLQTARERYQKARDHDQDNREAALEDLEFLAGDMWDETIRNERREDKRPTLTIDRISQAVAQVVGDMRQNNPAIKVRPADDVADKEVADVFTGLIRHIESQSDAQVAYITAGESAVQCGIGHFRIQTEYADDDTFEQNIRIRRIRDAHSVTWDPHAVEITREDARYCFVEEAVDMPAFKARYPNASTDSFDVERSNQSYLGDWFSHDIVRVAEYWTRTPELRTLALIMDGRVIDVTDLQAVPLDMLAEEMGPVEGVEAAYGGPDGTILFAQRVRKVFRDKIEMRIITGAEVLEGPFEWPGRFIPIIPVIGEEIHIGDRTHRFGVVRRAKDPQRMFNIWRSAQTEKIALEPKVPWLVTVKNITGYENAWQLANKRNLPYLPYTPDEANSGVPPQRNAPQMGSNAMAQEIVLAADDIKATTKIYDPGLGNRSNETSGKAILARQRESDTGTYVFIDNLSRALRRAGVILVDLIPRIYDVERTVRVLNEDGTHDIVPINAKVMVDGEEKIINDLSVGKYDVVVNTGPSYSTRRQEAADGMAQLAQAMPDKAGLFLDLLVESLDWPHADKIAERIKKTLPPGLVEPEEGEEPPPPPPPDPEVVKQEMEMAHDQERMQFEREKWAFEREKMQRDAEQSQMEFAFKRDELEVDREKAIAESVARREEVFAAQGPSVIDAFDRLREESAGSAQATNEALTATAQGLIAVAEAITGSAQAMHEAAMAMNAPKRIVKDDEGRPVGVEPVTIQ